MEITRLFLDETRIGKMQLRVVESGKREEQLLLPFAPLMMNPQGEERNKGNYCQFIE